MKRIWRISEISQLSDRFYLPRGSSSGLRTLTPFCFSLYRSPKHPSFPREIDDLTPACRVPKLSTLFTGNSSIRVPAAPRDDMLSKASILKNELLQYRDDLDKVLKVLEQNEKFLLDSYGEGVAIVELFRQLRPWPHLSLEVFKWRRNKAHSGGKALTADEYTKGITIAGRVKDLDMAVELFNEAAKKQIKTTSTYNALMGAYMWSSLTDKCKKLVEDFKKQPSCSPSIATYNILISVFGRRFMVDQMEAVFEELKQLKVSPNVSTYNNLIAEYIRALKWDKMEATFEMLKNSSLKPNIGTYLLMLRGYANSGNLKRMEEIYEDVKDYVNRKEILLIESMICAYYKSVDKDRVSKIETLSKLIPRKSYKPWLHVILIGMYAEEGNLEAMENSINEAFEREVCIETPSIMRSVVACYFRCKAVDKLASFVERAQSSGWRMCRSVYHGLMIMYGSDKRWREMEKTLQEMDNFNIRRVKKTFCILLKVYAMHGHRYNVDQVAGMMLKQGHGFPRPCDFGAIEAG